MDTSAVKLFHDFYFPLFDLVLKILIGVGVAFLLTKKGFRYKIKERLYDNYLALTKLVSEGLILRKRLLRRAILSDINSLKSGDDEWISKFAKFFQVDIIDHSEQDMSVLVSKIYEVINEISLYTDNKKVGYEFSKPYFYFFPRSPFFGILNENEETYEKNIFNNLKAFVNPHDDESDTVKKIEDFLDLQASVIDRMIIEEDVNNHPHVFLSKVKKIIASF